ncbi:UMP kinase [Candidatus Woesearchaeota archaeon]|nr:UMP kinase [Candidatus Woesearchaeota archaeon]
MKIAVISLGGSLIAPDKINDDYIKKFRQTLLKFRDYKFVIVAGGGKTARTYIDALENQKVDKFRQSLIGIRITRLNAWTLINLFKENCAKVIPKSLKDVKNLLIKNKIVVCGGLRYMEDNTSDGTAASIANLLNTNLINMTNVNGLYNKDPKLKDSKLIRNISFENFHKIMEKIKYKPGQHFVLDQHASEIIKKNKIKTYIIGPSLSNLENLLKNKKFTGTTIS